MDTSLQVISRNIPFLLDAAVYTATVSGAGMIMGLVLGMVLCIAKVSGTATLQRTAGLYISLFRGIPLLVQILALFYLLPHIGMDLPALACAILSVGLCAAAYNAEILRSAVQSIPHGQVEAAYATGMTRITLWRRILLPQAVRIGLPSLVNELVLLIKASSLASVIGIAELTRTAQNIAGQTYRHFEIYVTAGALYMLLSLIVATAGRLAEKRLLIPYTGRGSRGR